MADDEIEYLWWEGARHRDLHLSAELLDTRHETLRRSALTLQLPLQPKMTISVGGGGESCPAMTQLRRSSSRYRSPGFSLVGFSRRVPNVAASIESERAIDCPCRIRILARSICTGHLKNTVLLSQKTSNRNNTNNYLGLLGTAAGGDRWRTGSSQMPELYFSQSTISSLKTSKTSAKW